jgi:hypothetical protein
MTVKNTVTIAINGYTSTALVKKHYKNIAIFLPANWVTSIITFTGCSTIDGTYLPIVKGSNAAAVTIASVAASNCIVLDDMVLKAIEPVPYIKLVATTQQTTTEKIITIVLSR